MNSSEIDNVESASPSVSGEEVHQTESFAEMMERDEFTKVRLAPGEKVRGRVVTISDGLVYIDLGGKTEATIALNEFVDEAGARRVSEGDEVEAFFVSVQDGVKKLTTLIHGYSALHLNTIRDAWEHGQPVTGEVKREVKGGFEVSAGGVRCFCPFSQIDLKGGREGGVYLGQTFSFRVLDCKEDGRNIILSRRTFLDQQKQQRVEELRKSLSVGMEVTVRSRREGIGMPLPPARTIMYVRRHLSADALYASLRSAFCKVPDHRANGSRITMADALMSALAMFALKDPSLLAFDERRHDQNLPNLMGIAKVPCDTQMREILDPADPEELRPAFGTIFREAQRGKVLKKLQFYQGCYLLLMDGTGYFSSQHIHCDSCLTK